MKKNKTLSLLTLIGLLVAIPVVTGMFQRSGFELRISALEEDEPRNVVISDIKSTSFRVSWVTERQVIGGILMESGTQFNENTKSSYHTIEVTGLKASTTYTFNLLSDAKAWPMETGEDYTNRTSSMPVTDETFLVYGQVFSPDGFSFQQGGVISMQLIGGGYTSQIVSTIVNETGGYQFDLGGLQNDSLTRNFPYKQEVEADLKVYIAHDQQGVEKTFSIDFLSQRQIQNIYLGEVNIDIIPGIEGEEQ